MSIIDADKFIENSENLENELNEKDNQISFNDLFTTSFMNKCSKFSSFDEFLNASNFIINSDEDFENISNDDMDKYVKQSTKFSSWEEMMTTASEEYYLKQLGF